ncbi:hypothetical protein [Quisquiliibacterium transsilvanicum]|uniref:Uncharacterized protein n=1 Tax=Quisquiliibacterium transsilvanicum TaxID=1549638 RepID=A0A7W8M7D0_9BURK|nr:hypothetical protein [Quisquiliibacterium transsilvanicum]MBB5270085.1 hypothetical protein [Quisquiliibacterium transsilvanicum]
MLWTKVCLNTKTPRPSSGRRSDGGARRKGSEALTRRVEQLLDTLAVLPLDEPADDH